MFWSLRVPSENTPDLEFELGRTTVVVGGNGSGKSTLVEALAHAGWACPEARANLVERGVAPDSVTLLATGDAPPRHATEAELVHIAREGRLGICPADPAAIAHKLAAATVGLAPAVGAMQEHSARLAAAPQLEAGAATLVALAAQRQHLLSALANRGDQRARIAAQQAAVHELEAEIAGLDAELERAQAALDEQQSLGRGDALRSEAQRRLEVLAEQGADQDAMAALAAYTREALAELDALVAQKQEHEQRIAALEARRGESRTRHDAVVAELAAANEREPSMRRAAARATAMKQRLERVFSEPHTIELRQWRRGPSLAGALCCAGGVAAAVLLGGEAWLLGPGLGLALGAVVALAGRRSVRQVDTGAVFRSLAALADEWNKDREAARMAVTSPAEALAFLDAQVSAYEQLRTGAETRAGAKRRLEQELAEILDHSYDMLERTLPSREQAVGEWLAARGCQSREEYAERVSERETLETRVAQRAAAKVAPRDPQERLRLEANLHERIDTLTRRMGARRLLPADQLRAQESDLAARRERRAAMVAAARDTRTQLEALRGEVGGAGDLWTELVRTDEALHAAQAELLAHTNEAEAARRAAELLRELDADQRMPLAVFAHAAGRYLQAAGVEGTVVADGLDEASLAFAEPGAPPRPLRAAGRGTRDLVVHAARLALTEHLVPPGSILVLEEPFVHQDQERVPGALRMLREFQERTSAQLVLVTRDRALVEAARLVFRGPKVIDLDRKDAEAAANAHEAQAA